MFHLPETDLEKQRLEKDRYSPSLTWTDAVGRWTRPEGLDCDIRDGLGDLELTLGSS
jgi:hypothetical protein